MNVNRYGVLWAVLLVLALVLGSVAPASMDGGGCQTNDEVPPGWVCWQGTPIPEDEMPTFPDDEFPVRMFLPLVMGG